MTDTTKQIDLHKQLENADKCFGLVDGLLAQAGYAPDCSMRHNLSLGRGLVQDATRATSVSPAQPVAEVLAAEFGRRVAFLGGGRDLPKVGTKLYTAPVPAPATQAERRPQPAAQAAVPMTREQVAELMHGPMLTDIGYNALINGDTIDASLDTFIQFAGLLAAPTAAPQGVEAQKGGADHG